MRKNRRQTILFIIILLVLSIGIGYAFLTTTLSIDGVTDIDSNSWNVYFDNVEVYSYSVSGDYVTQAPTIDSSKTTVSFHVRLSKPGDTYNFSIDAINAGTLDAMIESVSFKVNGVERPYDYYYNNNPVLVTAVIYDNGDAVKPNQLLKAGSADKYMIVAYYNPELTADELPSTDQSISVDFNVTYKQADLCDTCYLINLTGDLELSVPNHVTFASTYQEAISLDDNVPMFLRARYNRANNMFEDMYLGFVLNNNVYYLRPMGSTYDPNEYVYSDSIYYEDNVATLNSAFGASNCEYDSGEYSCDNGTYIAYARKSGDVLFVYSTMRKRYICQIDMGGRYICGLYNPH